MAEEQMDWWHHTSTPLPQPKPARVGWYVKPLEPSLTEAPPILSWYQPLTQPSRKLPHPRQPLGFLVKPLDPLDVSIIVENVLQLQSRFSVDYGGYLATGRRRERPGG
jgi:hypothetical protein